MIFQRTSLIFFFYIFVIFTLNTLAQTTNNSQTPTTIGIQPISHTKSEHKSCHHSTSSSSSESTENDQKLTTPTVKRQKRQFPPAQPLPGGAAPPVGSVTLPPSTGQTPSLASLLGIGAAPSGSFGGAPQAVPLLGGPQTATAPIAGAVQGAVAGGAAPLPATGGSHPGPIKFPATTSGRR